MKSRTYLYLFVITAVVLVITAINTEPESAAPVSTPTAEMTAQTVPTPAPAATTKPASVSKASTPAYSVHVLATGKDVWVSDSSVAGLVKVTNPAVGSSLGQPAFISGLASGTWYSEGGAPFLILNSKGEIIVQGSVKAQGNWMTKDMVPFMASVTYPAQPSGSTGVLVVKAANPSGLPANDKSVETVFKFR